MKYRNWMELGSAVPLPSVRPNRAVVCVNSVGPRANKGRAPYEQVRTPHKKGANSQRCELRSTNSTTKYEPDSNSKPELRSAPLCPLYSTATKCGAVYLTLTLTCIPRWRVDEPSTPVMTPVFCCSRGVRFSRAHSPR